MQLRWGIKCIYSDDILNICRNPLPKASWRWNHSTINHKWINPCLSTVIIYTHTSFPLRPPLSNTPSYCLSSFQSNIPQSITALSLFSISFFFFFWSCISWLLACLLPNVNQSSAPILFLTLCLFLNLPLLHPFHLGLCIINHLFCPSTTTPGPTLSLQSPVIDQSISL